MPRPDLQAQLYVLGGKDGHTPILTRDVLTWTQNFTDGSQVAYTLRPSWALSTVFLGLEHGERDGQPLLFETMLIFAGGRCKRLAFYCTWAEAEAGHAAALSRLEVGKCPILGS